MNWRQVFLYTAVTAILLVRSDVALADPPLRVLLIGSPPDSHPKSTHEYLAGVRLLQKLLGQQKGIEPIVVQADSAWPDGPQLLDRGDGAVVFLTEGARWLSADPARRAAFERLAERKGGLCCLHWGMGTKPPEPIPVFVNLFGACHGGPQRKYKFLTTRLSFDADNPVAKGLESLECEEEYYYRLHQAQTGFQPLAYAEIDGQQELVGWTWSRPEGGRSFGFSGLHFHKNWEHESVRRMVLQGIVWTLNRPIPDEGFPVDIAPADLALPLP